MNAVSSYAVILIVLGAGLYLAPVGKLCELGRIAFFVGLFWLFKR